MFLCTVQVASAGADSLTTNNILYYSLDNANLTGTTIIDLSGNQNGTSVGPTTGVTGVINEAFSFDGDNDIINASSQTFKSISMWIKPDNVISDTGPSDYLWRDASSFQPYMFLGPITGDISNEVFTLVMSDGYYYWTSAQVGSLGTTSYHHIVLVQDGSTYSLYINGSDKGAPSTYNAPSVDNSYSNLVVGYSASSFGGDIDEIGLWSDELNTTEINLLYGGGNGLNPYSPSPSNTTISLGVPTPLNNSQYDNNPVLNTLMVNSSADFQCNLSLNGVVNQSGTYSNGTNVNVSFNLTFTSTGRKNVTWACNNTNGDTESTTGFYWFDDINPNIVTAYENATIFYDENVTGQFNLSDDVYLHSLLVTLWNGTVLTNLTDINATTYQYNLSFDPGGYLGTRTFTLRLADGHTAQELKSQDDWKISNGLFNDKLSVDWRGEYKPVSMTLRGDGGIWDSWDYKEEKDRVSFTYEPDKPAKTHTLTLTADTRLDIVSAPWTEYKNWVIIDDHWVDFQPYDINVIRISDREARVIVQNPGLDEVLKFHSAGDLNIITKNYTFTNINISETYTTDLLEGDTTSLTLNITSNGTTSTSASLKWNSTTQTVTSTSTTTNDVYTTSLNIPKISSLNESITHNWTYTIIGPVNNITGNITNNQTLYQMGLDRCENYTTRSINYTILDIDTSAAVSADTIIRYTLENNAVSRDIILNWTGNSTPYTCMYPAWASYAYDTDGTLEATSYALRSYDQVGLSMTNTTAPITLYMTNSTGTTTLTITVIDIYDNELEGYLVEIQKYNPLSDDYGTSGQGNTNYQGQWQTSIYSTDEYRFLVYDETGALQLTTNKMYIYGTTLTLTIDTGEGVDLSDLINAETLDSTLSYDNTTQTFSLSWSDASTGISQVCLQVNTLNNSYTQLSEQCSTNTTGSLNYIITASSGKYVAYSKAIISGEYYTIDNLEINLDAYDYGTEGYLFAFLLFVFATMLGIAAPLLGLALGIMSLMFGIIMGFTPLSISAGISLLAIMIIIMLKSRL